MTDETTIAAETTAQPAAVAQDAAPAAPAPEVAPAVEAAQAAPAAPLEAAPEALVTDEAADEGSEDLEEAPVHNLNALRGIPAGPAPHPRTV